VDSIQPQLDGLESWLKSNLQKDINCNHGNNVKTVIPTLESPVTAVNDKLGELQTILSTLESRVTDLHAGNVELESYVQMFKTFSSRLVALEVNIAPPNLPTPDIAATSNALDTMATSNGVPDSTSQPTQTPDQPAPNPLPATVSPQEDDQFSCDTINARAKVAWLEAHNNVKKGTMIPTSLSCSDADHIPVRPNNLPAVSNPYFPSTTCYRTNQPPPLHQRTLTKKICPRSETEHYNQTESKP
jgi:hypothetical protein